MANNKKHRDYFKCRVLIDSSKAVGITQAGVDAVKLRAAKYAIDKAAIAAMSNTKKRKLGYKI